METAGDVAECPVLIGNNFADPLDEAFIKTGGGIAGKILFRIAGPDLILNPCHADTDEFIQIAGHNRQEFGPLH
ncbi:hypothetical protein D3C86_1791960 [compost metagenome]